MARTRKASNGQQNPKAVNHPQSIDIAESANQTAAVSSTPILPLTTDDETAAIQASYVNSDDKSQSRPQTPSTIKPKSEQFSSIVSLGRLSRSNDGNVACTSAVSGGSFDKTPRSNNKKNQSTGSATNDETNGNDESVLTDDFDVSGVAALMTDESNASSIIDLTESLNGTNEHTEFANNGDQQQGSTKVLRKSLKKPLKRLTCTTTPRFSVKYRTSKGTPYIRKVSPANHRNNLSNAKTLTCKKERIVDEVKKNVGVKRVTFNYSPWVKVSSTNLNPSESQLESVTKNRSAGKMPNFKDIHKKMFAKMESIDVTIRKREERTKAASSKKENEGSSQGKSEGTCTKTRNVVRKLVNSRSGPSNILQPGGSSSVVELPKSVQSKSFPAAPKAGVLQECLNGNAIFQFTASSDSKIASHPLPTKKSAVNRSASRQQAFKARPVPKVNPHNTDRMLRGVRLNRRFELQMKHRENKNEL